jgi:hypothetical protein
MPKIASNFPGLSLPAIQALHYAGYTSLAQLTKVTEAELLALHSSGLKGMVIRFSSA